MHTENAPIHPSVSGYCNSIFGRDGDGAMRAVIVNPAASPANRVTWALGQLEIIRMVTEAAMDGGAKEQNPMVELAKALHHLIEQPMAVLQGVLNDLESPAVPAGPLRSV